LRNGILTILRSSESLEGTSSETLLQFLAGRELISK